MLHIVFLHSVLADSVTYKESVSLICGWSDPACLWHLMHAPSLTCSAHCAWLAVSRLPVVYGWKSVSAFAEIHFQNGWKLNCSSLNFWNPLKPLCFQRCCSVSWRKWLIMWIFNKQKLRLSLLFLKKRRRKKKNLSLMPCGKLGLLYLGEATAAARAVLPMPTGVCCISLCSNSVMAASVCNF